MDFTMTTLTPLWTGSVDMGKMDRIHETGIIGSLRWWYEAIARGLGGDVCNPTSDNRCPRRGNAQDEFCPVCQLFGATGCRRQFRLRVGEGQVLFNNEASNIPIPSGRIHTQPRRRAGGWYLMCDSVIGENIPLRFIPLKTPDMVSSVLRTVLFLIHRHAAMGAKVSNGYGVVCFCENGQPIQVDMLNNLLNDRQSAREYILPDIRDFFFAKFRFETPTNDTIWWQSIKGIAEAWEGQVTANKQTEKIYHHNHQKNVQRRDQSRSHLRDIVQNRVLPLAPAVRNWLRYYWNSHLSNQQKDYVFGTTRTICPRCCQILHRNYWCSNCCNSFPKEQAWKGLASKINISHAYLQEDNSWEFRVWGWIPCHPPDGIHLNRDQFLRDLQGTLKNSTIWQWVFGSSSPAPCLLEWHALDCQQQNGPVYLRELLGLNEGGGA